MRRGGERVAVVITPTTTTTNTVSQRAHNNCRNRSCSSSSCGVGIAGNARKQMGRREGGRGNHSGASADDNTARGR